MATDDETYRELHRLSVIENCVTLIAIAVCMSSVAYFASSAWGLASLLLLFNMNYIKTEEDT